jgi:hypothetical protein
MMRVELAWKPGFDKTEKRQNDQCGRRPNNRREPEANADENADGRCYPNRGRRGQSAHSQPLFEDDPGAEKSNAGHDSLRHPSRVGANGVMGK